jgi:hypothetical protein
MRRKLGFGAALLLAAAGAAVAEEAVNPEAALRALPGYVDLDALDALGVEATVEVNLRAPMLGLASRVVAEEEPELGELLAGLRLVRVRVFEETPGVEQKLFDTASRTALQLDQHGWERIVRVRDGESRVDVSFKPSSQPDQIDGVLIMAIDEGGDAVFVNVVGTMRPEDVARLGQHLDIDELEELPAGQAEN